MNKQIYKIAGVTENDYKQWCEKNNKQAYKLENKRDFFARVLDGRLVRDPLTRKLIRKYRKRR